MKSFLKLFGFIFVIISFTLAGDVEDIKNQILKNNEYSKINNQSVNEYSKDGALEFWSSGGLIQHIPPDGRPDEYDYINLKYKHIEIIILEPKKVAIAMYYSEGSMKPKNLPAISHYMTRVTQAYVKENGEWRVRASHWSPILGGTGTNQTSIE